jgi:23S rRNA (uridine2552-2'-O)-methyltransferase
LGASPGGWTQVVLERISKGGHVFAADLLDLDHRVAMQDPKALTLFKGDFNEQAFHQELLASLDASAEEGAKVDVILSDMMGELHFLLR